MGGFYELNRRRPAGEGGFDTASFLGLLNHRNGLSPTNWRSASEVGAHVETDLGVNDDLLAGRDAACVQGRLDRHVPLYQG